MQLGSGIFDAPRWRRQETMCAKFVFYEMDSNEEEEMAKVFEYYVRPRWRYRGT